MLYEVITQEEVYYNANYTYSSDLSAIGFTNSEGITVTIAEATNKGWSPRITSYNVCYTKLLRRRRGMLRFCLHRRLCRHDPGERNTIMRRFG